MLETLDNMSRHFTKYVMVGVLGASIASAGVIHLANKNISVMASAIGDVEMSERDNRNFMLVEQFAHYVEHGRPGSFLDSGYVPDTFIMHADKARGSILVDSWAWPVTYTDNSICLTLSSRFLSRHNMRDLLHEKKIAVKSVTPNSEDTPQKVCFVVEK